MQLSQASTDVPIISFPYSSDLISEMSKQVWAGGRFGDSLPMDCAILSCSGGRNQFTNTKFTRPIANISKSS